MSNDNNTYPCSYCAYAARSHSNNMANAYGTYECPYYNNQLMYNPGYWRQLEDQYFPYEDEADYSQTFDSLSPSKDINLAPLKDYGPQPFVINIDEATKRNNNYRTTLWTGNHLQLTLMSIKPGEDIGLEVHPKIDQFIRVEEGEGLAQMGPSKNKLNYQRKVYDGFAIFIPAGTWHNVVNTGNRPLKLYSIYAPPQHPHGTVHVTKASAHEGHENR